MRKYLLILFTFPFLLHAQEPVFFTEIVKVDNVDKEQLYARAKTWFNSTFNSAKHVIQSESKDNGEIVGKALFKYRQKFYNGYDMTEGVINYTIGVYIKDGRYKYNIEQFIHEADKNADFGLITVPYEYNGPKELFYSKNWYVKVYEDILSQIKEHSGILIESLKKTMLTPTETQDETW